MKAVHVIFGLVVIALVGCTPDPKSGKGFTLPEGDIKRGEQTFVKLNCQACHTVAGVTFDGAETSPASESPDQKIVALGGAKSKVQTYGDLVTSIINPSHRFAKGYAEEDVAQVGESKMRESKMTLYNDEMTIQQMVDLVTFLESHYSIIEYERTPYGPYYF